MIQVLIVFLSWCGIQQPLNTHAHIHTYLQADIGYLLCLLIFVFIYVFKVYILEPLTTTTLLSVNFTFSVNAMCVVFVCFNRAGLEAQQLALCVL